MSEDNKYDIQDLIIATAEQKPLEFENAFNDLVIDRIRDAIESKKVDIAQQMYGYQPPDEYETDEEEYEVETGDTELDNSEEEEYGEES